MGRGGYKPPRKWACLRPVFRVLPSTSRTMEERKKARMGSSTKLRPRSTDDDTKEQKKRESSGKKAEFPLAVQPPHFERGAQGSVSRSLRLMMLRKRLKPPGVQARLSPAPARKGRPLCSAATRRDGNATIRRGWWVGFKRKLERAI